MELSLNVFSSYLNRFGSRVNICRYDPKEEYPYFDTNGIQYFPDGRTCNDEISALDLVIELPLHFEKYTPSELHYNLSYRPGAAYRNVYGDTFRWSADFGVICNGRPFDLLNVAYLYLESV